MNSPQDIPVREGAFVSLADLLDNIFYFRWHFLVVFLSTTLLAILYAIIATPIYIADVVIQVEEKKGTSLGALSQVASALGAQQSPVLGEIEIARSRSVIGRAVSELKANIEVTVENRVPVIGGWLSRVLPKNEVGLVKPLFNFGKFAWGGEQIRIQELIVDQALLGKPLTLIVGEQNSWELTDKDGVVILKGSNPGELYESANKSVQLQISKIRAYPQTRFRIVAYSLQSRINQILVNYNVVEAKRQSSILRLTYQSPNPQYAATMLNAISDAYVQQNISRRSEEAELSLNFLNAELPKLRIRLDASERALNEFRSKTKTIDISSEIREILTRATAIEKNQIELDLKRREFAERYDPLHPLMKGLDSQMAGLKGEQAQVTRLIGQLPAVQQEYIRLARDVEVNNQLYVSLLNNAQQLQIAKAGTTGNVAIVDRAVTPEFPSRPRKALIVAVGSILGIILAFALCQVLALVSKIVRDPKKLEQETGLPTLAILPLDSDQVERIELGRGASPYLLAKEKSNASSIEALRSLRTSLLFKLSVNPESKVILITSAQPSQGKSFIAANLSYLFSAAGKRTLLIEADIRLASIKSYIDFDTTGPGLTSILTKHMNASDVIRKNVFENFDFLPSGPLVKNPGDLLAGENVNQIIKDLAKDYDIVIIDSPPLIPVHDARALGRSADLSLFIVRQDHVSHTEVHDAIDVFNKSGNTIDGIVFNGFIPSRMRYGYGYGYSYRGYRYKYRDGYRNYRKYTE